ncbi:uncharacterized protein LOC136030199 [Artemia franciscana]
MAAPVTTKMSENNNEIADSSYVHKKFKKIVSLPDKEHSEQYDSSQTDHVKPPRKRSSNSFSFETFNHQRECLSQESISPVCSIYDPETRSMGSSIQQCDTVDSICLKTQDYGIRFGIRDIIDTSVQREDPSHASEAASESHRKRCVSEGLLQHQVLIRPKVQRVDGILTNDNFESKQLVQNSSETQVVKRLVSDFSINNLMKNTSSGFKLQTPLVPLNFSQEKLSGDPRDNPSAFSTSLSFKSPQTLSASTTFCEVPKHLESVVDLSARKNEVMSRGLSLLSSNQFTQVPSCKEEKKSRRDDSPRVARELKFHNYTIDSVPYLISPTKSRAFVTEKKDSDASVSEGIKKFSRPTSLSLKTGSFQRKKMCMSGMDPEGVPRFQEGGHILISPDTPRPSKAYNQTFLNGYSYTTLGLKCSTKVYFCCLSKPQPMYVIQETDPLLSMYSQWQVRPSVVDLSQSGIAPNKFLSSYDSRQKRRLCTVANSMLKSEMIVTASNRQKAVFEKPEAAHEGEIHMQSTHTTIPDSLAENEAADCPLDMSKKVPEVSRLHLECEDEFTENSQSDLETACFNPVPKEGHLDSEKNEEYSMDEEINIKNELADEPMELSTENREAPCSSKSDPECCDSMDSEGSPESLVRRITDDIRNGKKTIGRGSSPSFNVCDGEGKSTCHFCQKVFSKASQLRLHINIHYIERPFKCIECGVSFRNKGHLKKHIQSAIHLTKVNKNGTFGIPSEDNPRPFKCSDCLVAFRIHGHLAKHLRSKSHIMKLECNGKLPFGTYAEIERSGININEIDTTDCQNTLDSLKSLIIHRLGRLQREKASTWDSALSN